MLLKNLSDIILVAFVCPECSCITFLPLRPTVLPFFFFFNFDLLVTYKDTFHIIFWKYITPFSEKNTVYFCTITLITNNLKQANNTDNQTLCTKLKFKMHLLSLLARSNKKCTPDKSSVKKKKVEKKQQDFNSRQQILAT